MKRVMNVFLDASVLIGLNYNYKHKTLVSLTEAIARERAHLLLTSVTARELKANISKRLQVAVQSLKKFQKEGKILRNATEPG